MTSKPFSFIQTREACGKQFLSLARYQFLVFQHREVSYVNHSNYDKIFSFRYCCMMFTANIMITYSCIIRIINIIYAWIASLHRWIVGSCIVNYTNPLLWLFLEVIKNNDLIRYFLMSLLFIGTKFGVVLYWK